MIFATEKSFLGHLWDSAHPFLAHFPIALLSFAFIFALLGYTGRLASRFASDKWNMERFYKHVWPLQLIGTIFIYPTMLFGQRDYDDLSEFGQNLAESHEEWGELTTNFYILISVILGMAILHHRYMNGNLSKDSLLGRAMAAKYKFLDKSSVGRKIADLHKRIFQNDPVKSFVWLVVSVLAFAMLAYTGYLGGELTHEQGIIAG